MRKAIITFVVILLAVISGIVAVRNFKRDVSLSDSQIKDVAENVFAQYLSGAHLHRSDFSDAQIERFKGDALVRFNSRSGEGQYILITIGRDGSVGVSPNLSSK
jgi:hypothetical protein